PGHDADDVPAALHKLFGGLHDPPPSTRARRARARFHSGPENSTSGACISMMSRNASSISGAAAMRRALARASRRSSHSMTSATTEPSAPITNGGANVSFGSMRHGPGVYFVAMARQPPSG